MGDNYKISRERLENIANRVRVMAGLTRKMTPAEIIYWLEKVKFTPMTIGESEVNLGILTMSSTVSGVIPEITRGIANNTFTLKIPNFTSTAIGTLQEE